MISPLWTVGFALLLSWLGTAGLIRWAPQLGLVDYPDPRKVHLHPTPRGGGLAFFGAFVLVVSLYALLGEGLPLALWVILGMGFLVVLLGLVDDLRPLPWWFRLGVQAVLATVMVAYLLYPLLVDGVDDLYELALGGLAVLWVVGLTNAFNMLDNMDGLSAGVAWIALGFFALTLLVPSGEAREEGGFPSNQVFPLLILMGAMLGFLWFNAPGPRPARIFMGDAGSTFLGFFLGILGVAWALRPGSPWEGPASPSGLPSATPGWHWLVPPCICAIACYDLTSVVLIRLHQGRSPFHPDKQHLSHRLVAQGLSSSTAVRLIYGFALASGVIGLLLYVVKSSFASVLVLLLMICAVGTMALADVWMFTLRKSKQADSC